MLVVTITKPNSLLARRYVYRCQSITIGRATENDVILFAKGIEKHHARLVLSDGQLVLVAPNSKLGTYVNERLVESMVVLGETDNVRIGGFTLECRHVVIDTVDAHDRYTADHPIERSLLHAIVQRDDPSRIIYADWLEQQGDHVRAEFVRIQDKLLAMQPGDPERAAHESRLGALAAEIDVAWRLLVASPAVERCKVAFRFQCPMTWSALEATERDGVRHCTGCQRDVYYALTVGEAREHAKNGHCVALDVTSARWRDDLSEPFEERLCGGCSTDIGEAFFGDQCPRCSYPIVSEVLVGEIDMA
jgi:uncharacterized protein (TIGR02996 family)